MATDRLDQNQMPASRRAGVGGGTSSNVGPRGPAGANGQNIPGRDGDDGADAPMIHNTPPGPTVMVFSKSGAVAAADVPPGTAAVFKDTAGGGVVLAYNDGGVIKSVALV